MLCLMERRYKQDQQTSGFLWGMCYRVLGWCYFFFSPLEFCFVLLQLALALHFGYAFCSTSCD